MSKNNKQTRQNMVESLEFLMKEINRLSREKETIQKALISMLEERNYTSESYDNGSKVTIVRSTYSCLDKEKLAKQLKLTVPELEALQKKCSEIKPKAPYLKLS